MDIVREDIRSLGGEEGDAAEKGDGVGRAIATPKKEAVEEEESG